MSSLISRGLLFHGTDTGPADDWDSRGFRCRLGLVCRWRQRWPEQYRKRHVAAAVPVASDASGPARGYHLPDADDNLFSAGDNQVGYLPAIQSR